MLFTDVRFVLLVASCWLVFAGIARPRRAAVLALWGVAFYILYAPAAAPLIAGLILATYFAPPRHWIILVALTIAVLVYYKLGVRDLGLASIAAPSATSEQSALMPLGLSFLTFELIHVAVERARGRIARVPLDEFMAYALYFPCRVSGPIRRYPEFTRSLAAARPSVENVYDGLIRVLVGIAKKVAIADVLGLTVGEMAYAATPWHLLKVLLAYSFQIYLDFSAYSDIAIGISRMFGIIVPENFRHPYLSSSIQEFWTRWHISLSTWVRDYVFLPLGRAAFATSLRNKPVVIAVASYLVSFLVIGGWHGLTANFILWGAYHGALLSLYYIYRRTLAARLGNLPPVLSIPVTVVSTAATFVLVTLGWILFMSPDLPAAARLLRIMTGRA